MIPVKSSNIKSIDYHNQDLIIKFINGGRYRYHGVPLSIWDGLKSAPSKGRYLHKKIKGVYAYEKIAS